MLKVAQNGFVTFKHQFFGDKFYRLPPEKENTDVHAKLMFQKYRLNFYITCKISQDKLS